jgi:hypothetical protein
MRRENHDDYLLVTIDDIITNFNAAEGETETADCGNF